MTTPFADSLNRFTAKVKADTQAVFVNTASAALDSIQNGSPVTGSPGQLVDTGNLKASWQLNFDTPTSALILTNVVYARQMEDGTRDGRALTQRSPTGGFHSVALTIAGLDRLVEAETVKMAGAR